MSGIETLSSVAAIFQLVGYGHRAHSWLSDLSKRAQDPYQSLEEASKEVKGIISLVESIANASSEITSTKLALRECIDNAMSLQVLLERLKGSSGKDGWAAHRKNKVMLAMNWKNKDKEIEGIWKKVERNIGILQVSFSLSHIEISKKTLSIVENMSYAALGAHSLVERSGAAQRQAGPSKDRPTANTLQTSTLRNALSSAGMIEKSSTLPPRNPRFVGQKEVLREIGSKLELATQHERAVGLVGLGGVGKSELAIEYAHQVQQESPETWIIFTRANSEFELELSYSKFACRAKIANDDTSLSTSCEAVKSYLESETIGRWLMIVDGADDADAFFGPKQLYQILPQTTYGSIVFTSRNENLMLREYFVPSKEHIIHLCRLERGDAVRLIQTRLGKSSNEMEHTLELIDLLEGLPLALSQAASFVSTSCGSIKEYLCLYRESEATRIELLREGRSHKDGSFSNPVATTWQISFDRIKRDNDFAAHLLSVGACLHCQQIPKSLLPRPDNSVRDKAAWSILKGYSMVTTSSDGAIFNMHPLVHLTIRHWLESNGQLEMYTQIAFDSVYGRFPEWFDQKNDLVVGDQYSIHAQTVIQNVKDKLDDRYVQLVSRASRYLRAKGDYKGALSYAQKAADLSRSGRGQRDLHTLTTLNDLVVVNWYLGNYLEAEKLGREVADLREQLLGTQHKDTLASLNNLGLVLNSRGKYEAAESLHRQVLKAREDLLGPTHNDTLKSLNNLGLSLKMQEKYEEAEEVFHRVFMERRGTLGTDQISTLRSMNNLGLVLQFRGKHEEAFIMHSGALQAKEIILGPEHPDTLRSKQNIAVVFKDQGRLEESEAMAREVLNEFMRLLGEHHPDTLCARSNLAIVLREQGKNRDAERMWQEVLDVQKTKLGPDHPQTIFSRTRLNEVADYIRKHPELDEAKTFTPPGLD